LIYLNGINLLNAFILGCCVGSFINVITIRLPKGQSVIFPRSKCLNCGYQLKWFDNIPIFSWVFLSGKCRNCKKPISVTYPFVEILTGFLYILNIYSSPSLYQNLPVFYRVTLGFIFTFLCVSLAILDFKYFWLPDKITIPGVFIGLLSSLIIYIVNKHFAYIFLVNSFSAAILGYLLFNFLSIVGEIFFKKPVLGGGDAKLAALLGSWLGVKGLLISIWLSFNTAGVFVIIGLTLNKINKNQKIPFGIFLVSSGLFVWHFGNNFIFRF
tara:strand:+ start:537 stop:1343 length:807 start_codon:yes stop_codon:yes gene_type:complete